MSESKYLIALNNTVSKETLESVPGVKIIEYEESIIKASIPATALVVATQETVKKLKADGLITKYMKKTVSLMELTD
jgi:hypothetical protein